MQPKIEKADHKTHKWQIFMLVTAGVFLSTLDSSMVNVALPSIMRSFSSSLTEVQWVVLIYLLTITISLLFWGVAADHMGTGRIYLLGIAFFSGASICCSLSTSLFLLVFFRFLEGLGAAMMMSSGPAIIRDVFPRHSIGKALGLVGIATSMGLMSGPVISGIIITHFSWRMVFLVNVPIGLLVLFSGYILFKHSNVLIEPSKSRLFDWKGAFFWAALISSFILYAHFLPGFSPASMITGFFVLGLLTALFIWAEKTRKSSILPLHLFGKRYFHIGLITAAMSFATLFVVLILMPFYLDYIQNLPPHLIGLVMMAVPLTLFVVSPTAGMLYDRIGSRYLTTAGLLLNSLSLSLLTRITDESGVFDICWRLALLGMGQSMFLAPNTASLLSRITDADAAVTSGLLATSRNLGMLVGAAFAGIVFAAWFGYFSDGIELRDFDPLLTSSFMSAFRATLALAVLFSLLAAIISWQRER